MINGIDVQGAIDFRNGIIEVTVTDGLKLPVKVRLPFVAVKHFMVAILTAELQMTQHQHIRPTDSQQGA
jgi:hypothetical protein